MTTHTKTKAAAQFTFARICTLVVLALVTVAGGAVTVVHPSTLPFSDYVRDLAIAWGLLGIGHGLDAGSKP